MVGSSIRSFILRYDSSFSCCASRIALTNVESRPMQASPPIAVGSEASQYQLRPCLASEEDLPASLCRQYASDATEGEGGRRLVRA